MRVQKTGGQSDGPKARGAKNIGKGFIEGSQAKSFDSFLSENQHKSMDEELFSLMEDIKKQGSGLANKINLQELLIYKRMVAQFLDTSVKRMLRFYKDDYLDGQGKHYVYALVQKVDHNLEALTKEVLGSQKDQLRILSYIDDIRGLLMDLAL